MLRWAASHASHYVISPGVGATRGNSVSVKTGITTTSYATNQQSRTTDTVTVTVR
jgi:hypothetical protein